MSLLDINALTTLTVLNTTFNYYYSLPLGSLSIVTYSDRISIKLNIKITLK